MVIIKPLDERLIKLLQKDAGQSSEVLAKQLKVSSATVRRRVRQLIKNRVMHIAAIADPAQMGIPLAAVFAFDVDHDMVDSVMQKLTNMPEFRWVSMTTGQFDIIAFARFPSTDELAEFLQSEMVKIEGIKDSEAFICLGLESKGTLYSSL